MPRTESVVDGVKVTLLYCDFCGREKAEVERLIAGPEAFICNGCVALCAEMLGQQLVPLAPKKAEND